MSAEPTLSTPPASEQPVKAEVVVAPVQLQEQTAVDSKPLINPLQTDTPTTSTIVEPPSSPNALNPASVQEPPSAVNGDTEPANPLTPVSPAPPAADPPVSSSLAAPPVPSSSVPTPLPDAFPTPVGTTFDPVTTTSPIPVAAPAAPKEEPPAPSPAPEAAASTPMDVDGQGSNVLKRPGDDLASEDVKRAREDGTSAPTTPAPAPAAAAAAATAPPVTATPVVDASAPMLDAMGQPVVYPWTNYVEPAPRNPGPTTPLTLAQHKYLSKIVGSLLKSNNSFNFREPVDVVRFNIPHYHQVIAYPMDLGTVSTKLHASDPRGPPKDKSKLANWDTSKGTYTSASQVSKDVRQIWENTRKFNGRDHVVSQAAGKLEEQYERALRGLPSEHAPAAAAAAAVSSPASAGPSSSFAARRASVSQPPVIRRADDSSRPKRDIHPPPSKDLNYEGPGALRKPKRRNDPQLQWAARTLNQLEKSQKFYEIVSHFMYPVSEIIAAIPSYTTVVKKPMDLLMVKQRLEDNAYEEVQQIDDDIRLIVSNARLFNPPGDAVHNAAVALLQLWSEKWRSLPPKQEIRDVSEDPAAGPEELDESDDEDKDTVRLREAKAERATLDREIADLEQKIARKPKRKAKGPPKGAREPKQPAQRKYSTNASKPSPSGAGAGGVNGNGVAKKPRKPKEPAYRDDDESDDEVQTITIAQKQELAEKIQMAEAEVLSQAVQIIQSTTNISGDQEIELDIDSLPPGTVIKLYNLVCRGRKRGKKSKPAPRKSGFGGAPGRKHLNEQEEADRIRKMEAQLQSFEGGRGPTANAFEDESSSEEESSDEE